MDVREKLVELLRSAYGTSFNAPHLSEHQLEPLASHLIAHGVTVQECGHWEIIIDDYDCEMMCCSVGGSEFYDGDNDTVDCMHKYCPHCGAKMTPQQPKGE